MTEDPVPTDRTCYIGVNIDTNAIPDGPALMECMREGFAELGPR